MSIYFVRHGESQANKEALFAGHLDTPLTELGYSQAKGAGEKLRLSGIMIDIIISSPLQRAHNTAVEIARAIDYPIEKIVAESLLKERNHGLFEGKPTPDSMTMIRMMNETELKKAGVETDTELIERAKEILVKINDLKGNVLIVSHSGIGRGLLAVTHEILFDDIQKLPNAQVFDLFDIPPLKSK